MGWGGRWEGGDIRTLMADSCCCLMKTTKFCNAIILQLKNNFLEKEGREERRGKEGEKIKMRKKKKIMEG